MISVIILLTIATLIPLIHFWSKSTSISNKTILNEIIVYAGDVINGIQIDKKLYGSKTGSVKKISLSENEYMIGIRYGRHPHRHGNLKKTKFSEYVIINKMANLKIHILTKRTRENCSRHFDYRFQLLVDQ